MAGTKYMGFLIKPASSACNMRCRYCFYYDVADHRACSTTKVMDDAVARAIIDKGLGVAPDAHVSFMFQGGEPTLAGLEFFERFVAYVDEHRYRQVISYALQTNGMLVDDRWAAFFKEHDFLVGISVDGYRELHDYIRLDASGKGTYARALRAFHLLQDAGVQVNALTVLTEQLARHPQQAFNALIREHIDHVQYIPCLPGLDEEADEFSLTPHAFASFYTSLLGMWLRELDRGRYVSIWLFENIMQMVLGRYPSQCGMLGRCSPQFVVEGDGSVYPCDFYALDEYRCGDICSDTLEEMATCDTMRAFLTELRRACDRCGDCPFEGICHRNCKRLNVAYYDREYCGLRAFLEAGYRDLARAARLLTSGGGVSALRSGAPRSK